MPHNILTDLDQYRQRPLPRTEQEKMRSFATEAEVDSLVFLSDGDSDNRSYVDVLRARFDGQVRIDDTPGMVPFLGYAIGLRKGAFGLPEETGTLWNEISTDAVGDFRTGLSAGRQNVAQNPRLSPLEVAGEVLDFFGQHMADASSAEVLGRVAGIHVGGLQQGVVL